MTESGRSRRPIVKILLPVGIALAAIAGCLFVAYGLNLINPSRPRVESLRVENRPSVASAKAGDVVSYVVIVSNGATRGTLEILSVTDTLLGDLSASFAPRLAAGASVREVFTRTVLPGDPDPLTNTVTVSVAAGEQVGEATSTAEVDLWKPAIGVEGALTPGAATRGEEVIYSITVSNVGEVNLEPITVTDSLQGDVSPSFSVDLPPGASQGQTFAWAIPSDAPDPLTRTVTVYAAGAGEIVSDTATVAVDVLKPAVQVETAVSPASTVQGETVTYTVTVANVGRVDLEAITVTDSLEGDLSSSFPPTLTAGASQRQAFAWPIRWNDSLPLTRTVTVLAEGSGGVVTDTAAAVVDLLKPVLRVEPSVVPATTLRGGGATYTLTVVNAGELDVRAVRVRDSLLGDVSRAFPRTLAAGTSHSRAYTWSSRPDAAGPLIRSVTVSGEGAGQVVSDTATAALNLAGIAISTGGPAQARAGEPVEATVIVTNTSSQGAPDLVLENVIASDRELSVPDTCRVLAAGEACTFSYEIIAPSGGDALTAEVEVRYRPEGQANVVSAVGEYTVAVTPPWQRGAGIPDAAEVRALAVCPADPSVLYTGFGSSGYGAYRSADAGGSWSPTALENADVFGIAVDPRDCDTVYAGAWRDGVQKTEDGGRSWDPAGEGFEGAFVYSVVVDPTDANVLYAGTAERGVYRSDDAGATWRAWGLAPLTVPHLSVTPDGQAVYAATWGDGIYRRARSGADWGAWAAVNAAIPSVHHDVYAVAVDPEDRATVFAATSAGGVYRSLDGGGTWDQVLSSPRTAYAVAVEPGGSDLVYAGTDEGVYRSTARGEPGSWQPFNKGLEGLAVRSLALGPRGAEYLHLGSADGAWRRRR